MHPLVRASRSSGVSDPRVLEAIASVPRERFVPEERAMDADVDQPIPIAQGQVTTQPSLVAIMVEALGLSGGEAVLEVGTGLGYEAAVLAELGARVWTIERFPELADQARENLAATGVDTVEVVVGDGTKGLPDHSPFDAIVLAAAAPDVPPALADQLRVGGRLVHPVGPGGAEQVQLFERTDQGLQTVRLLTPARFVPLVDEDDPSTR